MADGDAYTCDCTRTGYYGVNCETRELQLSQLYRNKSSTDLGQPTRLRLQVDGMHSYQQCIPTSLHDYLFDWKQKSSK